MERNSIGETPDNNFNEDEQLLMVHKREKLYLILNSILCLFFPIINLIYAIKTILYIKKSIKVYDSIIDNNRSLATVWYNIKVSDRRTKAGYRIERELRLSDNIYRPLLGDELNKYKKLLSKNKKLYIYILIYLIIISAIMYLPLITAVFTLL